MIGESIKERKPLFGFINKIFVGLQNIDGSLTLLTLLQIWKISFDESQNKTPGSDHLNSVGSASILISRTGPVEDLDCIRVREDVGDFLGWEVRSGGNHSFSW